MPGSFGDPNAPNATNTPRPVLARTATGAPPARRPPVPGGRRAKGKRPSSASGGHGAGKVAKRRVPGENRGHSETAQGKTPLVSLTGKGGVKMGPSKDPRHPGVRFGAHKDDAVFPEDRRCLRGDPCEAGRKRATPPAARNGEGQQPFCPYG